MKFELRITKNGTSVYTGVYDVADGKVSAKPAPMPGRSCDRSDWARRAALGALFEHIDDNVLDQLNGAHILLINV